MVGSLWQIVLSLLFVGPFCPPQLMEREITEWCRVPFGPTFQRAFLSYPRASCCSFVALQGIVSSLAKSSFKFTCMKKLTCYRLSSADAMQLASNALGHNKTLNLNPKIKYFNFCILHCKGVFHSYSLLPFYC
jgi:hypothetical protein